MYQRFGVDSQLALEIGVFPRPFGAARPRIRPVISGPATGSQTQGRSPDPVPLRGIEIT